MSNIYNIQQELLAIFDELEENGGELTPELEEQLNITQDEFKNKIKSYSDVVKMLENDIIDIKAEKARLNDLQKSKEKTIERIKMVMAEAIEMFGDTTKTGGKFVDFGTGKVSMRTTQAVEVEDDVIERFINRFITGLKWYSANNQLSTTLVNPKELLDYVNTKSQKEEDDNIEIDKFDIKDLERLTASINLDVDVKNLISTEKGMALLHSLFAYNLFKITAKPDKKGIKDDAKSESHFMPVYAKLVNNKSITIK